MSAISYNTLKHKTKRHNAGCGRMNGPSGVCVTPNRTKKLAQATRPLKHDKIKRFNLNSNQQEIN